MKIVLLLLGCLAVLAMVRAAPAEATPLDYEVAVAAVDPEVPSAGISPDEVMELSATKRRHYYGYGYRNYYQPAYYRHAYYQPQYYWSYGDWDD